MDRTLIQTLTPLDFGVFISIMVLTWGVVFFGGLNQKITSLVDYMLMGRRLSLPFFVATLVATWYGGIFGVTQIAFESGVYNFLIQGVFWYITYIIFAIFIVKRLVDQPYKTLPELIGKTVGPKSGVVASWFNLANVMPISYIISIGLFIKVLFGIAMLPSMILGTSFVLLYSSVSGFKAIVLSDTIQFVVMVASVVLVLVYSIFSYGGLSFLSANLPETHFHLLGTETLSTTLIWGFIALSTLVDPNFYQRCFAAQDRSTAKKGIYISVGIWILFDICTTGGGLYARAVLPEASSSQAYLQYALQLLPNGLRGFFLAGIVATILSTIDSYLFIASNTVSYDLFPKVLKQKPILWHRISLVLVSIFSIAIAGVFEGNIKAVWKTFGSLSAGCLLFPVLVTYIFPRRITDMQFLCSVLAGTLAIFFHRLVHPILNTDDFYSGLLFTSVTMGLWSLGRLCISTPKIQTPLSPEEES